MKIVYFSVTGQTRRFIKKLNYPNTYEINATTPMQEVGEPFILIVPTYDAEITEAVDDFLSLSTNQPFFKGVIGSGNRNFAELFIFTAKDIAKKYNVPLLYAFEFNGTPVDVENVKKVVTDLESKRY